MKKIKYLVFSLLLLLSFSMSILGLDCNYSDGKMNANFRINENSSPVKIETSIIKGEMDTKDKSHQDGVDEGQSVENWDKEFKKIEFKGVDYYNSNSKCPPYAILVDTNAGFDLIVSDSKHLSEFKEYGKEKQGYAVMNLKKEEDKTSEDNQYYGSSCADYSDDSSCEKNPYYSCLWVENEYGSYCNTDNLLYIACGDAFDIPHQVPELISFLVNFLKIVTPIILIFISIITLVKALAASKEDEIKKAQSSLIKKIIAAVMVFFVISIVQFVIMKVADSSETKGLDKCLSCFLNNDCGKSAYYKTNVAGTYECTYVDGSGSFKCKGNK